MKKAQSSVQVTSPANNSKVGAPVHYVATATSACSKGVASMGVYSAPGVLAYTVTGASLDANITLNAGTHNTNVQEWDHCGGSASTPIKITVSSTSGGGNGGGSGAAPPAPAPSKGKTFANLHQGKGWSGYALLPPGYGICNSCKSGGPETTWSMNQGVSSPSVSGNATQFNIGGQTTFSDALWNNHLIGDYSSQGLPDSKESLNASLHNFTYDVYFYAKDISVSQGLEFDINQFVNGQSFIWGHECRIAGGHEWDIWDNQGQKWHPTGIACNPKSNTWNHVVIQVQRTSDDHLLFQSITLNGKTSTLNYKESPTSTGWSGVTVNYQMDGDRNQTPYSIWLDKFNFIYW